MRKLDLTTPTEKNTDSEAVSSQTQTAVDPAVQINDNQNLPMKKFMKPIAVFALIAIVAGVGTGYAVNKIAKGGDTGVPSDGSIQRVAESDVKEGDVFGSPDENTFKDSAEGYLEAGGLDAEGSHRLLRPGGEAQTVYLTSSVTDLDKLVGMEVRVWEETFKGQKAGWLMDVGRVKVVKVNGESPLVE